MANPLEIGLVSASVLTFVVGLLAGVVVKRTLKLALAAVALVIVLALAGYINLSFTDDIQVAIFRAYSQAPSIVDEAKSAIRILPIASTTFIAGLGLGLWKG